MVRIQLTITQIDLSQAHPRKLGKLWMISIQLGTSDIIPLSDRCQRAFCICN